jgi:hypothetical protein
VCGIACRSRPAQIPEKRGRLIFLQQYRGVRCFIYTDFVPRFPVHTIRSIGLARGYFSFPLCYPRAAAIADVHAGEISRPLPSTAHHGLLRNLGAHLHPLPHPPSSAVPSVIDVPLGAPATVKRQRPLSTWGVYADASSAPPAKATRGCSRNVDAVNSICILGYG